MYREKALKLLRGGKDGITKWNRWRKKHKEIPDLRLANLSSAELSGVDLRDANLAGAKLRDANLEGANLTGAILSVADLTDAKVSDANLSYATLTGARLGGANLKGATLITAKLNSADLSHAVLSSADLNGADLSHAVLSSADLNGADLSSANLSSANLSGADLSDASVGGTIFADVTLSSTEGLDTLKHTGPSLVGLDTLQKSGEAITDSFLVGCGVIDDWLAYIHPMLRMGSPIQFYSCFISYSHQDEEFCQRLHSRMREDKLRVWYAPEDMKAGRKIHEQIDTAIRLHDKLLVVLSEHSMRSEWVANEIREAFKREKQEDRRVLFPISLVSFKEVEDWKLIDSRTGTDLAEEIRQYFIPDFTSWKDHDAFEATYQRLMKDFKPAPDDS